MLKILFICLYELCTHAYLIACTIFCQICFPFPDLHKFLLFLHFHQRYEWKGILFAAHDHVHAPWRPICFGFLWDIIVFEIFSWTAFILSWITYKAGNMKAWRSQLVFLPMLSKMRLIAWISYCCMFEWGVLACLLSIIQF